MADERDRRRQTGGPWKVAPEDEERAPQTAAEWNAFRLRILSEVDEKIDGLTLGIEARIKAAVKAELAPYIGQLSKLDDVLFGLQEMKLDTENYRRTRETQEREKAKVFETLEVASKLVGLQQVQEAAKMKRERVEHTRVEATRKHWKAILVIVIPAALALATWLGTKIERLFK